MFGQKFAFLIVFLSLFLLPACAGQPSIGETVEPQQPITNQSKADIDIQHIEVHRGDQIVFSGETTLSEGECIFSQLFEDGTPVGWWPVEKCLLVTGADWQFAVPLGVEGAPEDMDDAVQFHLKVWWASAPEETVDEIYFDLAGPQTP